MVAQPTAACITELIVCMAVRFFNEQPNMHVHPFIVVGFNALYLV